MGWPQLIYLALNAAGIGVVLAQHGKPRDGTHNVWHSLIGLAITMPLLFWGGFFS